jgi:hypothetical protein
VCFGLDSANGVSRVSLREREEEEYHPSEG